MDHIAHMNGMSNCCLSKNVRLGPRKPYGLALKCHNIIPYKEKSTEHRQIISNTIYFSIKFISEGGGVL